MKKILGILLLLISFSVISSCFHNKEVELLYSASYLDTNDFDEIVEYIDNYDSYSLSGYQLDLDRDFFDKYILYSVSSYISVTARNLYLYSSHRKTHHALKINLKEADIFVSDGFSMYALIFKIDKSLYKSIYDIIITVNGNSFETNKYDVEVLGPSGFILEPLKRRYKYGQLITVKTTILLDASLSLYINNEFHSMQTVIEQNGVYTHWEYYVTMPDHDISLSFLVIGDM